MSGWKGSLNKKLKNIFVCSPVRRNWLLGTNRKAGLQPTAWSLDWWLQMEKTSLTYKNWQERNLLWVWEAEDASFHLLAHCTVKARIWNTVFNPPEKSERETRELKAEGNYLVPKESGGFNIEPISRDELEIRAEEVNRDCLVNIGDWNLESLYFSLALFSIPLL